MSDELADRLRSEIRRVDEGLPRVDIDEVLGARQPTAHADQRNNSTVEEWIMPVTKPTEVSRGGPTRLLAVAAAAVALVALVGVAIGLSGDEQGPVESGPVGVGTPDQPEESTPAPTDLSPIEIVEARYEAMAALDVAAIDLAVSPEVVYCQYVRDGDSGCFADDRGYFGFGGWGAYTELRASTAYAYGGALAATCVADGDVVTCEEIEQHLLLDAAGVEMPPRIVTYAIEGDEIQRIEVELSAPIGPADAAVRRQALEYGNWAAAEYSADHGELFLNGQPVFTPETAERHRTLVSEWAATLP